MAFFRHLLPLQLLLWPLLLLLQPPLCVEAARPANDEEASVEGSGVLVRQRQRRAHRSQARRSSLVDAVRHRRSQQAQAAVDDVRQERSRQAHARQDSLADVGELDQAVDREAEAAAVDEKQLDDRANLAGLGQEPNEFEDTALTTPGRRAYDPSQAHQPSGGHVEDRQEVRDTLSAAIGHRDEDSLSASLARNEAVEDEVPDDLAEAGKKSGTPVTSEDSLSASLAHNEALEDEVPDDLAEHETPVATNNGVREDSLSASLARNEAVEDEVPDDLVASGHGSTPQSTPRSSGSGSELDSGEFHFSPEPPLERKDLFKATAAESKSLGEAAESIDGKIQTVDKAIDKVNGAMNTYHESINGLSKSFGDLRKMASGMKVGLNGEFKERERERLCSFENVERMMKGEAYVPCDKTTRLATDNGVGGETEGPNLELNPRPSHEDIVAMERVSPTAHQEVSASHVEATPTVHASQDSLSASLAHNEAIEDEVPDDLVEAGKKSGTPVTGEDSLSASLAHNEAVEDEVPDDLASPHPPTPGGDKSSGEIFVPGVSDRVSDNLLALNGVDDGASPVHEDSQHLLATETPGRETPGSTPNALVELQSSSREEGRADRAADEMVSDSEASDLQDERDTDLPERPERTGPRSLRDVPFDD